MKSNGVRDFIIQNFLYGDDGRLQENTSFLGGSIIDSTGILELVAFLEEKYGITISDDEIIPANLDSLKNIDGYVNRKLNGSQEKADEACMPYSDDMNGLSGAPQAIVAKEQIFPETIDKVQVMPKTSP